MSDFNELKRLALAATPQNFDSAEEKAENGYIECPHCGGSGEVELEADYCNYDNAAIGVQFYGIGHEFGAAEAYYRAANPRAISELVDDFDRVTAERDAALVVNEQYRGQITRQALTYQAMQQRLTAAHERWNKADMVLRSSVPEKHKGCTSPVGAVQNHICDLEERADVLEGLLRMASVELHDFITGPLLDRIDAALKTSECGGDE